MYKTMNDNQKMIPIQPERIKEVLKCVNGLLNDKVIVITGGNKGVGAELAIECCRQGAKVVIGARNKECAREVLERVAEIDGDCTYVYTDLLKVADCQNLINKAVEKYDKIDGFVNYAGLLPSATMLESEEEMFDEVMGVNIKAAMFCCKYVVPEMQKVGGGSIVFIGSPHAYGGDKDRTIYALSKGALLTLMKHISSHYQTDQIRSNWITMGWIATPGEMALRDAQGRDHEWLKNIAEELTPAGRLLEPIDLIPGIMYLLSDLSPMVSGTEVDITGGLKCK